MRSPSDSLTMFNMVFAETTDSAVLLRQLQVPVDQAVPFQRQHELSGSLEYGYVVTQAGLTLFWGLRVLPGELLACQCFVLISDAYTDVASVDYMPAEDPDQPGRFVPHWATVAVDVSVPPRLYDFCRACHSEVGITETLNKEQAAHWIGLLAKAFLADDVP